MPEHLPSCAQTEKRSCPSNRSLHDEAPHEHWWSGWPGALCLKCGDEDADEVCIGGACACACHEDFWRAYEDAVRR